MRANRCLTPENMTETRNLILVLDDDQSVLTALTRALKVHGFAAEPFRCPQDFLANAKLGRAACVLLDIDLGAGISGFDISARLKASAYAGPVIFMTGSDSERTRAGALRAGCAAYLTKPFSSTALLRAIRNAVAD